MKRLAFMLFATILLGMAFVSCGDEKDEPVIPEAQTLESDYQDLTETRFMFDIDMEKDSSSIYIYNIVFTIGTASSPAMNIRVDAPVTVDKTGKVFTFAGTGIHPYMQRGSALMQLTEDRYLVTNLNCTVNTANKTYDIAFDCHGGHFDQQGKLK